MAMGSVTAKGSRRATEIERARARARATGIERARGLHLFRVRKEDKYGTQQEEKNSDSNRLRHTANDEIFNLNPNEKSQHRVMYTIFPIFCCFASKQQPRQQTTHIPPPPPKKTQHNII